MDPELTPTEQPVTPPAEAPVTETPTPEALIPKARFDDVNKRMKDAEKKLADLQRQQEEAATADLAEKQQFKQLYEGERLKAATLEKQFQDMQKTMQRNAIASAVEAEARRANFAEPADAYLFLNLDDIQLDEAGRAQGVEELVKGLATSKPYLVSQREYTPGNSQSPKPVGVAGTAAIDKEGRTIQEKWAARQF